MHKIMFIESESKYNYEKTIEELKTSLEKNNWDVFTIIDRSAHYQEKGFNSLPITTMEVCKPKEAINIIKHDKFKSMIPMMPMRVAVYEDNEGRIIISRMRLKMMKKMMGGPIKVAMKVSYRDLENSVKEVVKE
jgi:uncharacterized protein (DUF302 family)